MIGETGNTSIFHAHFSELDNSICSVEDCDRFDGYNVWTGIEDAATFATITENCEGWSVSEGSNGFFPYSPYSASYGTATKIDGTAFSWLSHFACSSRLSLYCVEQP